MSKQLAALVADRRTLSTDCQLEAHLTEYYARRTSISGILRLASHARAVNQLLTGIFLTMNYKPDASMAFASVEIFMRDVDSAGGPLPALYRRSMFFVVVYLQYVPRMMYGSYRKPRELSGDRQGIFFMLMMLAFTGYILPGGKCLLGRTGDREHDRRDSVKANALELASGDFMLSDAALNRSLPITS